jgi:hypothetical protein
MTHATLADAIKAGIPDGHRPYKATVDGKTVYVVDKGPKSAAVQIVKPEAVPQKDMMAAYKELVVESYKKLGKNTE